MLHSKLTYANVVSTLCLVLLLTGGGVAYAQVKVGSGDLKKDAVKSKHIKNGKVKSKDIKDGTVQSRDVRDGSLTAADLADGVIPSIGPAPDIGPGSITGDHVEDGTLTGADVQSGSLGSADVENGSLQSLDIRNGTLRDSDFGPNSAVPLAGVNVHGATGTVRNSFNRLGGAPTSREFLRGVYVVEIPGVSASTGALIFSISTLDDLPISNTTVRCYVSDSGDVGIQVSCRDQFGTFTRASFSLTIFET